MTPADQNRFPALPVTLKDGRCATVRPLRLDDGPALGAFYERVPPEDFRFYCPHELTFDKGMENAALADSPLQVVLVMETPDRRVGGYAWCRWSAPDADRSTLGICIDREYQGSGAGRALMERLITIAGDGRVGPSVIGLTVQLANPRAIELYKSLGFRVVREQVRAARPQWNLAAEPECVMELEVRRGS